MCSVPRVITRCLVPLLLISASGCFEAQNGEEDHAADVRRAEAAFARTMAARDLAAFALHIAPDAIFFSGDEALHGRDRIVEAWSPLFEGDQAPFSWEPEVVEVLPDGSLALSSGPVYDPTGNRVGSFNSIWRREGSGRWRVIFDRGCDC